MLQKPNFVTGASKMRKLVELEKLAVYWDTDARPVGDVPANQLQVSHPHIEYVIICNYSV